MTTDANSYFEGVFAARDFKNGQTIGLYLGKIERLNANLDSVYTLTYKGRWIIDIPVEGEERLHFGLGMHMMNDLHWNQRERGEGNTSNTRNVNNVMMYDDLTCCTLRDIKCGEELTTLYNPL